MWFLKYFLWGKTTKTKKKRGKHFFLKWVLFIGGIIALLYGCSTCNDCTASRGKISRIPSPVSNLSVVFVEGAAQLYWADSVDYNFDHVEVSWRPDGKDPIKVAKALERARVPSLREGVEYTFIVHAVDKWGNQSETLVSGTGKGFYKKQPVDPEADALTFIKGKPTAGQVTLSWINPDESEYEYIEITYSPDNETDETSSELPPNNTPSIDDKPPIRIHKGVESKQLVNLANDVEYSFSVLAVDAEGNRNPLRQLGLYVSDHAAAPESAAGRSSGNQVLLTWREPHNIPFEHIELVYAPGGETPVVLDKGVFTATFTNLSDVIDYEFTVYMVDIGGRRRPLTTVHLSTPEIPVFNGRDAEVLQIKGVPVAGQVILNWDDPALEDLDHIVILFEPDGRDEPVIVEAGAGTKTIYGLADGRVYSFLAYGVDLEDNNRAITGLQLTTPIVPRLIAQPVGGKVTLLWNDPHDPALNYFELSYSPDGAIPFRVGKGREGFTFTNLSDGVEYEFKVGAVGTTGNRYAVIARVYVARLPVLTGPPVNRQLSISWMDPVNVDFDHIEIVYSPGGERPLVIAKGVESRTFYNLIGSQYTFTIYARDSAGNRHPVGSPRFYDPRTAFVVHDEVVPERVGELKSLNWRTSNSIAAFGENSVNAVAFGVASNGSERWVASGGEGSLAYSNDYGLNWTLVKDSPFGYYSVDAIGYGNGRWVAGSKNGRLAWSANGTVWNLATKSQTVSNNINAVAYGEGRWMAGANDGVIMSSDDNGATWRVISTNIFDRSAVNTIVYHRGRWIIGGAGGKIAYSNNNGISWNSVDSTFGTSTVNVIVRDRERWVAGGYAQRIASSENGINWTTLPRPFYILCMGSNGYRLIAGGQEGRMAWSGNGGETWVTDEQGQNFFGSNWVQTAASGKNPNGGRRWLIGGQEGRIIFADEQF